MKATPRLYVDACNVVHQHRELRSRLREGLGVALGVLVGRVRILAEAVEQEVYVVIDGRGPDRTVPEVAEGRLFLVYTMAGETADAWIERELHAWEGKVTLGVATADGAILQAARTRGADAYSPEEVVAWADREAAARTERLGRQLARQQPLRGPEVFAALDDLFRKEGRR